MRIWARIRETWKRFAIDRAGAAAVEFVIMIPLLLSILIFGAEYSNALMAREALESALRDATRMIARSPLGDNDANNNPDVIVDPFVQPFFLSQAEAMIAERTGLDEASVGFKATPVVINTGGTDLRTPYIRIDTEAFIVFGLPMLRFIHKYVNASFKARDGGEGEGTPKQPFTQQGFTLQSADTARYSFENFPGVIACKAADRNAGICGGPGQ